MYYIDVQDELAQLHQLLQQQQVTRVSQWRVTTQGSLQHWQDILLQLASVIDEHSIWFNIVDDADLDVYLLMEQEITFKRLCLELSTILRLSYDLGIDRNIRIVLYQHILNLWFGYADLLASIQQHDEMQGTAPLILELDYAYAILLMTNDLALNEGDSMAKIMDGLLMYQSDRLLDVLTLADLHHDRISEDYAVSYPFVQLDTVFQQTVDETSLSDYVQQIEADQQRGYFWDKKRFHALVVFGQWRFEALALAVTYQLDLSAFKCCATFPTEY